MGGKPSSLILLDIDETLLRNGKWEVASSVFREVIAQISVLAQVGIISFRDVNGVRKIAKRLSLNGPVLAEGGGIILIGEKHEVWAPAFPDKLKSQLKCLGIRTVTKRYVSFSGYMDNSHEVRKIIQAIGDTPEYELTLSDKKIYISHIDSCKIKTIKEKFLGRYEKIFFITDYELLRGGQAHIKPEELTVISVGENESFNAYCDEVMRHSGPQGALRALQLCQKRIEEMFYGNYRV